MVERRKLIEVALPLEEINAESAREKSIRHGHPSTLHLWWARRPLAAARAVLFAQLVDDPSSHPDRFRTEDDQRRERERLHAIIERLVKWENVRDERVLGEARAEILASTGGDPPPILDPFAGGGTIPLEAQRLGLEAHASDLNPVAVLINKALIEIPPKFRDRPPVFPGLADGGGLSWQGAQGLAADVRAYGEWMRDEAERRIGHLYPKATLPDGSKATVIAWIWARTVTCPNPGCGIEMPLVRSWWLGKKKGKEAYVVPAVVIDFDHPSGKRVAFTIGHDPAEAPTTDTDGTVGRRGAVCVACQAGVELAYIRAEGKAGRMGARLMATVAEGQRRRIYLAPTPDHEEAARVDRPADVPPGDLPEQALGFRVQAYGMTEWADLFTNRQLIALTTFGDLVIEARERALKDAVAAGMPEGERLEQGGTGAAEYADAIAIYLGLGVSRLADIANALCAWENTKTQVRHLFTRQAIPMLWDYAEAPPFGKAAGSFEISLRSLLKALVDTGGPAAQVSQVDASALEDARFLISTDPPYYDNVGYADLSDFFYVWLRRSLREVQPRLLSTMLVPKSDELVAEPARHGGDGGAKEFFERGFREVFARARGSALDDYPITVYYAFKQSDAGDDGQGSTGWETLLEGMIRGGWSITATWPMRSELSNRIRGQGSNALASSIVLALRPRPADAPTIDRRGFIAALQSELPTALRELQQGAIAAVDLPQAVIGPGMAVFSRYAGVLEPDGSQMSVHAALTRINEVHDAVGSDQEADFDPVTRFAVAWYRQHGYDTGPFGDANSLATARGTAVESVERTGILTSRAGKVTLLRPGVLDPGYDVMTDPHASIWEVTHHLIRVLDADGIPAAGAFLARAAARTDGGIESDLVKELAHLAFSIANNDRRSQDAVAFNNLVTAWPSILDASRQAPPPAETAQTTIDFDD